MKLCPIPTFPSFRRDVPLFKRLLYIAAWVLLFLGLGFWATASVLSYLFPQTHWSFWDF